MMYCQIIFGNAVVTAIVGQPPRGMALTVETMQRKQRIRITGFCRVSSVNLTPLP